MFLEAPSRKRGLDGASAHIHYESDRGVKCSDNMAITFFPW